MDVTHVIDGLDDFAREIVAQFRNNGVSATDVLSKIGPLSLKIGDLLNTEQESDPELVSAHIVLALVGLTRISLHIDDLTEEAPSN